MLKGNKFLNLMQEINGRDIYTHTVLQNHLPVL